MLTRNVHVHRVHFYHGNNVRCIGVFESFREVVPVIIKTPFGPDLKCSSGLELFTFSCYDQSVPTNNKQCENSFAESTATDNAFYEKKVFKRNFEMRPVNAFTLTLFE